MTTMIDFEKMLADLQTEARKVAEAVELERRVDEGKAAAGAVRERLETDPKARMAAAGAGGLLLAGLLGTKGGRNLIGGVAKTGAVAALGALAYRAWQSRETAAPDDDVDAAVKAGYVGIDNGGPAFAEAIVRVMVATAHADGVLDEAERAAIEAEMRTLGADDETRMLLTQTVSEAALYEAILPHVLSPNHAAQLYAAASIVAGAREDGERGFLSRLANRLGVDPRHAAAMEQMAG